MKKADQTNDISIIGFTMKGIIASDRLFTIPGVIIITAGGFAAALHADIPIFRTGWLFWPILLFSLSGIVFGWKLAPLQRSIAKLASSAQFDGVAYKSQLRQWENWGLIASLLPLAALCMMVLKIPLRSI